VQLTYNAHSCFALRHDDQTLVIDPYDQTVGYKLASRPAQVTLVSHDHFDHNCTRAVSGRTSVVRSGAPRHEGEIYIRGVMADHDAEGGALYGKVTLFCWSWGGLRFCHLSDLGQRMNKELLAEIGPVDVLFVPTGGGGYTLGPAEAWEAIGLLKPALAIPMHYRTPFLNRALFPELQPLEAFADKRVERLGGPELDLKDVTPGAATRVVSLAHFF